MRDQLLFYLPLALPTFIVALVLVAALTPYVAGFARRVGALQQGGGRRVHEGAVPNIGGVAIFGGFMGALLIGGLLRPDLLAAYREELLAIVLGGALMTLVGLFDDLWEVPALTRLACQFVAAGIVVVNGVRVDFITNYFGASPYQFFGPVLAAGLTLLWIVGFTNAFNFIDGLDGLSSGLAAISSLAPVSRGGAAARPGRGGAPFGCARRGRFRVFTAQLQPRQGHHGRLGRVSTRVRAGRRERARGAESDGRRNRRRADSDFGRTGCKPDAGDAPASVAP